METMWGLALWLPFAVCLSMPASASKERHPGIVNVTAAVRHLRVAKSGVLERCSGTVTAKLPVLHSKNSKPKPSVPSPTITNVKRVVHSRVHLNSANVSDDECAENNPAIAETVAFSETSHAIAETVAFSENSHAIAETVAFSENSNAIAVFGSPRQKLPVNWTTAEAGAVWYGERECGQWTKSRCVSDASFTLHLREGDVAMISFPFLMLKWTHFTEPGFLELSALDEYGDWRQQWNTSSRRAVPPRVYTSNVHLRLVLRGTPERQLHMGFSMLFSVHRAALAPRKVREGVFDCSTPTFASFRHHVGCNLRPECAGGEDEGGHCSFSSALCRGNVSAGDKCLFSVTRGRPVRWGDARSECHRQGGNLVTLKTADHWRAFFTLMDLVSADSKVYVGLRSADHTLPAIYKKTDVWVDGAVNYQTTRTLTVEHFFESTCFVHGGMTRTKNLFCVACDEFLYRDMVCEVQIDKGHSTSSLDFPLSQHAYLVAEASNNTVTYASLLEESLAALLLRNPFLVQCKAGHMIHDFLSCDPRSHCGADVYVKECPVISRNDNGSSAAAGSTSGSDGGETTKSADVIRMFVCDDERMTLPYTLVCDFRRDCWDGSDEDFCLHRQECRFSSCDSGQCVLTETMCDGVKDCWDGSDEVCSLFLTRPPLKELEQPPAILDFDRHGNVSQESDVHLKVCPRTHFRCPENYCLPVYSRCNGVADCQGKEDEQGCEGGALQCAGHYRCLHSSVCLSAQQLCDGWPQCPQRDDEWMCNTTCPRGCLCQGQSFICPSLTFDSASSFPSLRYLDAAGSGTQPRDVTGLSYLLWLSLARCGLVGLTDMDLPNLLFLDLSRNQFTSLHMGVLESLMNLRELDLSHNPLALMVAHASSVKQKSLAKLDLSWTTLVTFNSTVLINFPRIRDLKLSSSSLVGLTSEGLKYTPSIGVIDLRGNEVHDYSPDIFLNLTELHTIYADNYKLCCKKLLPAHFDEKNCFAPVDEVSSCDDLLRSNNYRAFLWMFSVLSIAGNMGCLVTRLFLLKSRSMTSFNMFVANLSMADLLMGVYLAMVGAADHVYRGQYFWFEKSWKPSVACQIAGFLSLLSSETSAFIICLITLDRFLVLSSPFSDVRFRKTSTAVACTLAWTLGLVLAVVPLLPVTSEWQFYSQTGICIPLPVTRRSFKGRDYAVGIIIFFNLVLFLLIAVGQAMIYWTIRTTSMAESSNKKNKDLAIARRLVSVVVSDFLCWFPIGILGVMATAGTPIPGEVNVGMAIFVLPLNAALNPFLYTFKALTERWKTRQETRLLRQLEARGQENKTAQLLQGGGSTKARNKSLRS